MSILRHPELAMTEILPKGVWFPLLGRWNFHQLIPGGCVTAVDTGEILSFAIHLTTEDVFILHEWGHN